VNQSATCIPDFSALFHTRREHYRALLELSRRQIDLIAADDYTGLLVVLGQKQRLLGRLDEMNGQHADLKRQWHDRRESLDPDLRDDCEHILAETEAILAQLLEEEQQSAGRLTERRDETRRQLQTISRGSQVHDAYRDTLAPATHRHLDVGK
jgi:hypothetical protein